jgi:hypothetical protein
MTVVSNQRRSPSSFNVVVRLAPTVLQHLHATCLLFFHVQIGLNMVLLANMEIMMMIRGELNLTRLRGYDWLIITSMSSVCSVQSELEDWYLTDVMVPGLSSSQFLGGSNSPSHDTCRCILHRYQVRISNHSLRVNVVCCIEFRHTADIIFKYHQRISRL